MLVAHDSAFLDRSVASEAGCGGFTMFFLVKCSLEFKDLETYLFFVACVKLVRAKWGLSLC